jgi:DNA-binding GntR family transcriptional regulator
VPAFNEEPMVRRNAKLGPVDGCYRYFDRLSWVTVNNATQILDAIQRGDRQAADQLLPLTASSLGLV